MDLKYKALMLDVDGTLIPYDYGAFPSKNVCDAVKKAQAILPVSLVTGRSYSAIKDFLPMLGIEDGFAVTNGGAVVVNLKTMNILYKRPIPKEETEKIVQILRDENMTFFLKTDPLHDVWGVQFAKDEKVEESYMILAEEQYSHKKMENLFNRLSQFPNLTLHKTKHFHPDKYGFTITHVEASKLHGIEVLVKEFGVKREEIIGVGDSYNDFPLLMASGLKVAMGNAIDELKEVADYVAPPVTKDGVTKVIEKFILKP